MTVPRADECFVAGSGGQVPAEQPHAAAPERTAASDAHLDWAALHRAERGLAVRDRDALRDD
eukprot:2089691-Rhodomonas_salina.1